MSYGLVIQKLCDATLALYGLPEPPTGTESDTIAYILDRQARILRGTGSHPSLSNQKAKDDPESWWAEMAIDAEEWAEAQYGR